MINIKIGIWQKGFYNKEEHKPKQSYRSFNVKYHVGISIQVYISLYIYIPIYSSSPFKGLV